MMVLDQVNIIQRKLSHLPNHKHHKSKLEANSSTADQKALQMLAKLVQQVQELMTHQIHSETMLKDLQLGRKDQIKLEKESVLDIILLRELKV